MESEATFGMSERDKPTLLYGGFEFWQERNGTTAWKCCKAQTRALQARVTTMGSQIVKTSQPEHSHEGNQQNEGKDGRDDGNTFHESSGCSSASTGSRPHDITESFSA